MIFRGFSKIKPDVRFLNFIIFPCRIFQWNFENLFLCVFGHFFKAQVVQLVDERNSFPHIINHLS